MLKRILVLTLLSGLLAFMAGCSKDSASPEQELSIAQQFGGFTPTDEAPNFGDPDLTAGLAVEAEYNDIYLDSLDYDSVVNLPAINAYALRIIWGSPCFDSTITELTDWTGSLSMSRGGMILRRTIGFEPNQDYILPRTDRKLIEWVSFTSVHHDGIFVYLFVPPFDSLLDSMAVDTPVTVTFDTEPFEFSFRLDDLSRLDTVFYLDDSVNVVAFRAFKITPRLCPGGFLEGKWGVDSTGQGIFKGRWISRNGMLAGYVKGIWGPDTLNDIPRAFYGKWIDVTGRFEGLLKGVYRPHPNWNADETAFSRAGGKFFGYFYDANANPLGALKGHYMMPRWFSDDGMGYFAGRWKTFCGRSIDDDDDDGMDDDGSFGWGWGHDDDDQDDDGDDDDGDDHDNGDSDSTGHYGDGDDD